MKIKILIALLALPTALQAEALPKLPMEHGGKKFLYSDYVQLTTGGASPHFILVHEDIPDFSEVALMSGTAEFGPLVPYVCIGKLSFPLSHYGVYLISKTNDRIAVSFLFADYPRKNGREAVEDYVRYVLKKPGIEVRLINWLRDLPKK